LISFDLLLKKSFDFNYNVARAVVVGRILRMRKGAVNPLAEIFFEIAKSRSKR